MKDLGAVLDPLDVVTKGYVDGLGANQVATSTSVTATAGQTVIVQDPLAANVTVTLPWAPADGTRVTITREDGSPSRLVTLLAQGDDGLPVGQVPWRTSYTLSYNSTGPRWEVVADGQLPSTVLVTGIATYTAAAGQTLLLSFTSPAQVTLPTSPPDGSTIRLFRLLGSATPILVPGTGDTISGGFNGIAVSTGAIFVYSTSNKVWYPFGVGFTNTNLSSPVSTATVLSLMARDSNGRTQVATPSASGDAATKGYVDTTTQHAIAAGANLTGTTTAVANTFYTADATGGTFAVNLPSAPTQGTQITIWRTDSTTNNINVGPGGTDTIADNTGGVWQIYRGAGGVTFTYVGTSWYASPIIGGISGLTPRANTSNVAGAIVQRDGNGRARFNDPAAAQDAATKNYVDRYATAMKYGVD